MILFLIGFITAFVILFIINIVTSYYNYDFENIFLQIILFIPKSIINFFRILIFPFIYPRLLLFMIKHKINPWHNTVSGLLKLSEKDYEELLKYVPKKHYENFKRLYENNKS